MTYDYPVGSVSNVTTSFVTISASNVTSGVINWGTTSGNNTAYYPIQAAWINPQGGWATSPLEHPDSFAKKEEVIERVELAKDAPRSISFEDI